MKRPICLFAGLLLLAGTATAQDNRKVQLFNGRDFTGWTFWLNEPGATLQDVWSIDPATGVLVCKGMPWGYLRTSEAYTDYTLHVEYRWNPETRKEGNTGIFFKLTGPDKQWPRCIEAQGKAGWGGDFVLMDGFEMQTPAERIDAGNRIIRRRSQDVDRPAGEWNVYEITVSDSSVEVRLNGVKVNEGTGAPAGPGYIALQSEGGEVQFRNVYLVKP